MKRNQILDLFSFGEEAGQMLCKAELSRNSVRGRPSFQSLLNYCLITEKKTPPAIRPVSDLRYDGFDHLPEATHCQAMQTLTLQQNWTSSMYGM